MAPQQQPDPWPQDYERQRAAGLPQQAAATAQQAPGRPPQAAAPAGVSASPRKLIVGGLVAVLVIVAAIIGHGG